MLTAAVLVLLNHGSDIINPYKQAWALHANQIRPQRGPIHKHKSSESSFDPVIDHSTDWAVEHAAYIALTYMATSHYGKLRIVGSIGLRLLPVIAVIAVGYSIYKWIED